MRRFLFRRLPLRWRHRAYARAAMELRRDRRMLYARQLIRRLHTKIDWFKQPSLPRLDIFWWEE